MNNMGCAERRTRAATRHGRSLSRRVVPAFITAAIFAGAASAATLSAPSNVTADPGETVRVPVRLDDAGGVLGYFFEMTFDESFLSCVGVDAGGLAADWGVPAANIDPGRVYVGGMGAQALTGSGTLAFVELEVSLNAEKGEDSPLHFTEAELNDGAIPVTLTDGLLTVSPAVRLTLPNLHDVPGAILDVSVALDDADDVIGYYFEVSFDNEWLEVLTVETAGTLVENWGAPQVNIEGASLSAAGTGAVPLSGAGTLMLIRMRISPDAPYWVSSPLHFEQVELNDTAIPVSLHDGLVYVESPDDGAPLAAWPLMLVLGACACRRLISKRGPH